MAGKTDNRTQPSPDAPQGVVQGGKARTIGGSWRDGVVRGSDAPDQGKPVGGTIKLPNDWA